MLIVHHGYDEFKCVIAWSAQAHNDVPINILRMADYNITLLNLVCSNDPIRDYQLTLSKSKTCFVGQTSRL